MSKLLAPGGALIMLEGTAPLRFLDLTFGLTEGWWKFSVEPTAIVSTFPLSRGRQFSSTADSRR